MKNIEIDDCLALCFLLVGVAALKHQQLAKKNIFWQIL
jgi:hypothetical protein